MGGGADVALASRPLGLVHALLDLRQLAGQLLLTLHLGLAIGAVGFVTRIFSGQHGQLIFELRQQTHLLQFEHFDFFLGFADVHARIGVHRGRQGRTGNAHFGHLAAASQTDLRQGLGFLGALLAARIDQNYLERGILKHTVVGLRCRKPETHQTRVNGHGQAQCPFQAPVRGLLQTACNRLGRLGWGWFFFRAHGGACCR